MFIKKSIFFALCTVLLCGCNSYSKNSSQEKNVDANTSVQTETFVKQTEKTIASYGSTEPKKSAMSEPQFELVTANSIRITGGLENVSEIRIYLCETDFENNREVTQILVLSTDVKDLEKHYNGYEISFDPENNISESTYKIDNSGIKAKYYAKGIRLGFFDGSSEIISNCVPTDVCIETGRVNQYDAELRGDTACGAASGTLLLQSVYPVWNGELTSRMSIIRDYSAISFDYSVGADFNYYMSGEQIANSVNKYLEDMEIKEFKITDMRTKKSTEETLLELVFSGRPAVLEVCYADGEILNDYAGFSHWITINGFRVTDSGYEFRWENTIGGEQNWVTSELLENANKNVTYNSVDFQPTRYIAALSQAVTDNII